MNFVQQCASCSRKIAQQAGEEKALQSAPPYHHTMMILLASLGVAYSFTLPDIPDMPDFVESVQSMLKWNFTEERVEEPKTFLPSIVEIDAMSDEEKTDRFHWFFSVFVMVYICFLCLGSGIMIGGAKLKARGDYQALDQTAPLSKEAQILLVVLSLIVTISLSFAACLWSVQTGRLSKDVGVDWEVYLFLFSCGGVSLLVQAVVAVAWLKAGARFDATAFAVASMSVLPFVSDQFDTLKDIIFGALCFQSEHWAMKVLGVLSWLYLVAFHAWFVSCAAMKGEDFFRERFGPNPLGANCFSELATSHLAVLLTGPKVDGESSAGCWEGTILPMLYKQLTPSKRQYLLIENLPQAVLSLLFLFFEGGSMFIVVLNLALPAVQIFLASLLFKPVRAAAASALGKTLNRAVQNGNLIAAKTIWEEAGSLGA